MSAQRPEPPVTVVGVKHRDDKSPHAVFAELVVRDANGNLWSYRTSQFLFDMTPMDAVSDDVKWLDGERPVE